MSQLSAAQGAASVVGTHAAGSISGAAATSGGSAGKVTSATTIASLAELKVKAPEIYNKMMESIGMELCNQMQRSQDRLKQMWEEANRR